MEISQLAIAGYRSIRDLPLELGRVNVITGPNGCGKSNLYRSVVLVAAAARGELARALAAEGGMPSVLWAGPRTSKKKPVRLQLRVRLADQLDYELQCGLPIPHSYWDDRTQTDAASMFTLDPEVEEERLRVGAGARAPVLMERKNDSAWLRDDEGRRVAYPLELDRTESILGQLADPHRYPELSVLREAFGGWRFYHQFRTDPDTPLRRPRVAVSTPVLAHDGADLACALQTILEVGDRERLQAAIRSALPNTERLIVESDDRSRLSFGLQVSGLKRPIEAPELSDGTLRYLCLVAALLSPRPPSLLAFNEPETSLHPDLIDPLAELLAHASRASQLWITTHSKALAARLEELTGDAPIGLEQVEGETLVAGQDSTRLREW